MLLEQSGYSVTALGSDAAVQDFLSIPHLASPGLVLMCHSVPEKSRVELCSAIKLRYPSAPILMLYNGHDPTAAKVDGRLENMADPLAILNAVQLLLSTKLETRTGNGTG